MASMLSEQWKEILNAVNLNEGDILEQIKAKLQEQDKDVYEWWARENFDINHLFDTLVTLDNGLRYGEKLTLLHLAAKYGKLETVKYLIEEKNVDINKVDRHGCTALYWAAKHGHLEVVKYFIEEKNVDINLEDGSSRNALHWAARHGHLEVVKYFIEEKNVDINKIDEYGNHALHWAARHGHLEVVKYFIEEKNVDVNKVDRIGQNALHLAAGNGHLEVVKYFIEEKNVDINLEDKYGRTVLHLAAGNGHLEVVKYFIEEKNVDVNKVDKYGNHALHLAALNGHFDMVRYLVENGADVNKADYNDSTALHLAAEYGCFDIVKYLIEKKNVDVNKVDRHGCTALHLAIKFNHMDVIELIINHIAKLENVNLYVSQENLQLRSKFISTSSEKHNNYSQHLQNCKEEAEKIEKENNPLYDFLRESSINNLVVIWKKNESVRSKFDNQKSLYAQYPEYANILINKANEVKKEILLRNLAYAIRFNNHEGIKAILDEAQNNNMLDVLTAVSTVKLPDGQEHTLTPLAYAIRFNNHEGIKTILDAGMLEDALTAVSTVKFPNGQEHTLTPLTYAICLNNQEGIKAILDAAKDVGMLKEVLTAVSTVKFPNGEEHTLTPLTYAICLNNQEGIKAILDAAKDVGMLEDALTAVSTVKFQNGQELTLTPLAYAIYCVNQELAEILITYEVELKGSAGEKPDYLAQHDSDLARELSEYWDKRVENMIKEIFLHNHKPLIDALLTYYERDFKTMTFSDIKKFFIVHSSAFKEKLGNGGITLINFVDFQDIKERHIPTLKVQAFIKFVESCIPSGSISNPDSEQHQAAGRDRFA
ncbi:MAG: Phosphocholine transferase AnkX [Wolbachia endosymbiont of Ctenocephalides felis wCfeF]|nr:MAG: Phosphocholine transferase AnkX [Wolbachia endosymbiont of Ctenocephalides felis wCfeF]